MAVPILAFPIIITIVIMEIWRYQDTMIDILKASDLVVLSPGY